MFKITIWCSVLFGGCLIAATELKVEYDGQPVTERGIFIPGCIYGDDASLSDHAPMLWPKDKIGTWNITSRVSHKLFKTPKGNFMGHKFKTNAHGVLIDGKGKPAILGHESEADILTKTTVTNLYYGRRLHNIGRKIKFLFSRHNLEALAIQEIPYRGQRDADGNDLQKLFAKALGPELTVFYPTAKQAKGGDPGDKVIDAALVARAKTLISSPVIDQENRMQAFCDRKKMTCVTSVHLVNAATERDVEDRCKAIQRLVDTLHKRGFKKVSVLGDFNMSADKMVRGCKKIRGFSPSIHTSTEKAKSCATNDGDASPNNIDLLLKFEEPR